jgi:muconolactone delta-isomerase
MEGYIVLFMLYVKLAQPALMSNQEFYGVWMKESEAAMAALQGGMLKAIYKVAGKNEVMIILDLPTADEMDHLLQSTPIFQLGYIHIVTDVSWTPLRDYGSWMTDLTQLANHI